MLLRKVQICEEVCHLSKHHVKSLVKMMLFEDKTVEMLQDMAIKLLFNKQLPQFDCNDELLTQIQNHINEKKQNSSHKKKKNKRKKHTIKTNSNQINTLLDLPTVLISSISQYLPNQETILPLGLTNRELYLLLHPIRMPNRRRQGQQQLNENCQNVDQSILPNNQTTLILNCTNIYRLSKYNGDLSNYCKYYKTLIVDISEGYFDLTDFSDKYDNNIYDDDKDKCNGNCSCYYDGMYKNYYHKHACSDSDSQLSVSKILSNLIIFERMSNGELYLLPHKRFQNAYIYQLDRYSDYGNDDASVEFVINAFKTNILDKQWFKKILLSIETLKIYRDAIEIVSLFPLDILFGENSNLKHIELHDCSRVDFEEFNSNLRQSFGYNKNYNNNYKKNKVKHADETDENVYVEEKKERKTSKIEFKGKDVDRLDLELQDKKKFEIRQIETFTFDNESRTDELFRESQIPDLLQSFTALRLLDDLEFDMMNCCHYFHLFEFVQFMTRLFHPKLKTLELYKNIIVKSILYDTKIFDDLSRNTHMIKANIQTLILHQAGSWFWELISRANDIWIHLLLNWFETLETIEIKFDSFCFDDLRFEKNRQFSLTMFLDVIGSILVTKQFKKLENAFIMFTLFFGHYNNSDDIDIKLSSKVKRLVNFLRISIKRINEHNFQNVEIGCRLIKWEKDKSEKTKGRFGNDNNYSCVDNHLYLKWTQSDPLSIEKLNAFEKMASQGCDNHSMELFDQLKRKWH